MPSRPACSRRTGTSASTNISRTGQGRAGLIIAGLTHEQKQQVVKDLSTDGAFGGKNSAAYISRILGMGRATVYKYLNQDRDE
ncbi:helix-turn-helix domain-containing protein (plasmid) [Rhizobium sp. RCAM05350]|nr:helix-turn-helix domain-containing protein [Rhizobium sp. RCAM05350]